MATDKWEHIKVYCTCTLLFNISNELLMILSKSVQQQNQLVQKSKWQSRGAQHWKVLPDYRSSPYSLPSLRSHLHPSEHKTNQSHAEIAPFQHHSNVSELSHGSYTKNPFSRFQTRSTIIPELKIMAPPESTKHRVLPAPRPTVSTRYNHEWLPVYVRKTFQKKTHQWCTKNENR